MNPIQLTDLSGADAEVAHRREEKLIADAGYVFAGELGMPWLWKRGEESIWFDADSKRSWVYFCGLIQRRFKTLDNLLNATDID